MISSRRFLLAVAVAFLAHSGAASAQEMKIGWPDLLPPGSEAPAPIRIAPRPSPEGREIELPTHLDGKEVEISGYLLPADREGELVYAFMLVPRSGACAHMQQPPPAQVVRVVPDRPYRLSMNYEPVTVTGRLSVGLEKTQLFILDGVAVIESGYRISMADVARAPFDSVSPPSRTPWSFLTNRPGG